MAKKKPKKKISSLCLGVLLKSWQIILKTNSDFEEIFHEFKITDSIDHLIYSRKRYIILEK